MTSYKSRNTVAMRYKTALFYHVNHVIDIYNLGDCVTLL